MKFRMDKSRVFMTLAKGDNINKTFESFAEVKGVGCAWLNGIGALENPEIGYYSLEDKSYHRKTFSGEYELISLIGNISLKDGKPFIVIGSPGGSTIITTAMQVIMNVVIHGMDIKEAVTSPRFHSQWVPDVIMTEPRGLSRDVIQNLKARGHILVPYKWGYIGEANGILITEDGFYGGGDSRGETSAIGY